MVTLDIDVRFAVMEKDEFEGHWKEKKKSTPNLPSLMWFRHGYHFEISFSQPNKIISCSV